MLFWPFRNDGTRQKHFQPKLARIIALETGSGGKQRSARISYSKADQIKIIENGQIAGGPEHEADHPPTEAETATTNEENEEDTNNVPTYRNKVKTVQTSDRITRSNKGQENTQYSLAPSPQVSMYVCRTPPCTYYPLSIPV